MKTNSRQRGISAVEWFYGPGLSAARSESEIWMEPRGPGWFLVYGEPTGPVGVFGYDRALAKCAELRARGGV